jgi:glycosyltransferase involved in cell wall biosynthesis
LPEVAGEAALLVDPHDAGQFAAELLRVLQSPALQSDLRARGLARAREFSWDRTALETMAVYDRVAGR